MTVIRGSQKSTLRSIGGETQFASFVVLFFNVQKETDNFTIEISIAGDVMLAEYKNQEKNLKIYQIL